MVIKNLPPKEVAYDLPDDRATYPGLRLRISPKGKKTWFYRYKNPADGKTVKLTIGVYGQSKLGYLSLADARGEWTRLNQIRRGGGNPKEYEQERTRGLVPSVDDVKEVAAEPNTVRKLVRAYVDKIAINRKSWHVTKRILNRELDQYMDTPACDVTKGDIRAILDKLNDRPVMSNRTLAAIRAMYNWAIKNSWPSEDNAIEVNPCMLIDANEEISRDRTLSEAELKTLLNGLPKSLLTDDQQDVLLFTLLTGCRIGEACAMESKEVHDTEWRLPGSKTKNGRSHTVYLSPPAKAILKRHQGETYVFHSNTTAQKHLRVDGVEKALRLSLKGLKLERFTPHDLRRTFASWCGEKEIPETVHDRLLNHYQKSLRKTYNTARYNKPAKAAWLKWGRYIAMLRRTSSGR